MKHLTFQPVMNGTQRTATPKEKVNGYKHQQTFGIHTYTRGKIGYIIDTNDDPMTFSKFDYSRGAYLTPTTDEFRKFVDIKVIPAAKHTVTLSELDPDITYSVKDNSPRGVHTARFHDLKIGDKIVIDNYFHEIIEAPATEATEATEATNDDALTPYERVIKRNPDSKLAWRLPGYPGKVWYIYYERPNDGDASSVHFNDESDYRAMIETIRENGYIIRDAWMQTNGERENITAEAIEATKPAARDYVEEIIDYFDENEDIFNDCIEELDGYDGYLGDDRRTDMEILDECMHGIDPLELLTRAFYGYDDDNWITDEYGHREAGPFNPNRNYFYFNGYGNLVSTNYKNYSAYNDRYAVQAMSERRQYIDSIENDETLAALFDALEEATENE